MGERPMRRRGSIRWRIAALAVVGLAATLVTLRASADRPPLDQARQLVADDDGFGTGLEAGQTLAEVAQKLELVVEECRRVDRGPRCQASSAALGYAQVLASHVLVCTAPGRHEARRRMERYLDEVSVVAPAARRLPDPPPLPSCAA